MLLCLGSENDVWHTCMLTDSRVCYFVLEVKMKSDTPCMLTDSRVCYFVLEVKMKFATPVC